MSTIFEKLQFHNRLGRLTSRDTEYWRMLMNKILKAGIEYEVQVPMKYDIDETRYRLITHFAPTDNYNVVGQYGVQSVTTDGSVRHGLEIITVGRRFDWKVFYEMNKNIMDAFSRLEFYTSNHTGMHVHLLAGYNHEANELERPMPEIILANIYQLHRIFAPELYWMASGGDKRHAITRYSVFRRPPFDFSAVNTPMQQIRNQMNERYDKYQMVNMNNCHFLRTREIDRFHIEIRHPDTHLSPAYATALVALEVAIINKAIDLSQCGIISMKQEEFDFRKELTEKFVNLGTGDRESDSTELTDEDIETLQIMSSAMVRWFKSELMSINKVAYDILQKIAHTPSCLMRIEGKSWQEIEEEIYTPDLRDYEQYDSVVQAIILQQVTECKNPTDWKRKISAKLNIPMRLTSEILEYIGRERLVAWDEEVGSMIFKQIV